MILCTGNKVKTVTCKLKDVITLEKGIVLTKNHLELIIFASNYFDFEKICRLAY